MDILIYRPAKNYIPAFGASSQKNLESCHPKIQKVLYAVIAQGYDISVTCGYRNEVEQTIAHGLGNSKLTWPNSKHNHNPSFAVDVAPYFDRRDSRNTIHGIPWDAKVHPDFLRAWSTLNGVISATAHMLNVELEWGGHWYSFKDHPHYQLTQKI